MHCVDDGVSVSVKKCFFYVKSKLHAQKIMLTIFNALSDASVASSIGSMPVNTLMASL